MSKNGKSAFQESIEKKKANNEFCAYVVDRVRRPSRGQKECKIPAHEGFCKVYDTDLQTPALLAECGGLLFAYAKTAALH